MTNENKKDDLLENMHIHDVEIFTIKKSQNLNQSKQNTNFLIYGKPGLHNKIGQEKILKLINTYRSIMSSDGEILGQTNLITVYINTEKHFAIYTRQYPISNMEKAIVDEITNDLLNKHVIKESISPLEQSTDFK